MSYQKVSFPVGSKFLITGGAGFIGSNVTEALLNAGYKVRCLDDFSNGKRENITDFLSHPNYELVEGSITDLDTCMTACHGVGYVSHQAAWGSVPRSIQMPLLYEEINIRGTLNMMEAAKEHQVKKFVYASSSSVYGDEPTLPKVEGREGNVLSPYALTKKTNEEYGRLYAQVYGLETVGLRYFNVFGRRQNPHGDYAAVIPKFLSALLSAEAPTINGDGEQSRDFTYIENVIEGNLKALASDSEVSGEVFNIACGGQVTLKTVYETLERLVNVSLPPKYGPDRVGDIKHSNADIRKAQALLRYQPDYSFEEGITEAVDWYKNNLTTERI